MTDDLSRLKDFHGHLGPYVVAGYRMGCLALERLAAEKHFGIEAEIASPGEPPPSCFLDGIQFSTGCTLGKQNIRPSLSTTVSGRFHNRRTGAAVAFRLRPEAIAKAVAVMQAHDDEAGAAVIQQMALDELLEELPAE